MAHLRALLHLPPHHNHNEPPRKNEAVTRPHYGWQQGANDMLSLRIPRGLWEDLETTVLNQDKQFLREVAISLGLPPPEVIRQCLGTSGVPTSITTLWSPARSAAPEGCPWWECHGDNMWRRCPRLRLSDTLPCHIHERCTPCPLARLDSDPFIRGLPWIKPVQHDGQLFWVEEATGIARREDGFIVADGRFKRIRDQTGEHVWVWTWTNSEVSQPSNNQLG